MTLYQFKHLLIQMARHASRLAVMLLVVGLVFLSLYAHYRAARALEDEQYLKGARGSVLVGIDKRVATMKDPQAFLDGYKGTLWSMLVAGVPLTQTASLARSDNQALHAFFLSHRR